MAEHRENGSTWPHMVWKIQACSGLVGNAHINNMNITKEEWPWLDCWKAEKKENKRRNTDKYILLTRQLA